MNGATMNFDPMAFALGCSIGVNLVLTYHLWRAYRDRYQPPF